MRVALSSHATAMAAAGAAAARIVEHLTQALRESGRASLAVSGGTSPAALFTELATADLDWPAVNVFQVDERWVGSSSPHRNWGPISRALVGPTGARPYPLTVSGGALRSNSIELIVRSDEATMRRCLGSSEILDVVHLGLGTDGHTASWPPGPPLRAVRSATESVRYVSGFNGFDRTTLTPSMVNRARHVVWYVVGEQKRASMSQLLDGDDAIPASLVNVHDQELFTDLAQLSAQ